MILNLILCFNSHLQFAAWLKNIRTTQGTRTPARQQPAVVVKF